MPGLYRGPYEVWLAVEPTTNHRYEIFDDYDDAVEYAKDLAEQTALMAFVRDGPTGRILKTERQKHPRKRWRPR